MIEIFCRGSHLSESEILRQLRRSSNLAFVFAAAIACLGILRFWLTQNSGPVLNAENGSIVSNALFFAVCGWGIRRKSRVAALLVLVTFGSMITMGAYLLFTSADPVGPAILLIALVLFMVTASYWAATRAAFAFHKMRKQQDPAYRSLKTWHLTIGIPALSLFVALSVFGALDLNGYFTHSRVVAGAEIPADLIDELIRNEAIAPNEAIHLLYAPIPFSMIGEGYLLTDKNFVAYEASGPFGSLYFYQIPLDSIASVKVVSQGDYFSMTVAEVTLHDGSELQITLPPANNGDSEFLEGLSSQASTPGTLSF